jgi:putative endonuclease
MHFVYVLSSRDFKKSYVGLTDDIDRRLRQHNDGKSPYTAKYKPWELVHTESFVDRAEAAKREKFLKSKSGRNYLKAVIFKG